MKAVKKGFFDGIPIGLGYLAVSFTFGIQAMQHGLTIWEAVLISMMNLTSAGQFAGLTIMYSAGSLAEMALAQLVINLRYSLMSLSLTQKVDESMNFPKKLFFGFFHTDEIYAVAIGQDGKIGWKYFVGLIIAPYIGWTLGTFLGGVCGAILPELIVNALGVALYGMFIAIFVPEMKKSFKMSIIVIVSVILSCFFAYAPFLKAFSGKYPGFVVIICAVVASLLGAIFFPLPETEGKDGN